jgi:hypothetical protein
MIDIDDLHVGDIVRLRKPHPCGTDVWRVRRIGGDVGLTCEGCGRRIFLPRSQLARRLREVVRPAQPKKVEGNASS